LFKKKEETMSPEQINRKLAEWCGWTDVAPGNYYPRQVWGIPPGDKGQSHVPNYHASLDAVHEVEVNLTQAQRVDYANTLAKVCGTQHEKIFASAAQKCEALLKTLGLCEEAP
jgi:hypothetical protein